MSFTKLNSKECSNATADLYNRPIIWASSNLVMNKYTTKVF